MQAVAGRAVVAGRSTHERAQRVFDVVVGSLGLLVVSPLIAVGALLLVIQYRCSPLFVHDRVGRDGELFSCVKLRTLPPTTPAYADKYVAASVRIPWLARMIRRLKVDELPQLALVVAGRMSLVGPRPEMAFLHERLDPHFARMRTAVRPGCTGMWQIGTGCRHMIADAPEFDLFYVDHASLRLDLWITYRTLVMILTGRTTSVDDVPRWARRPRRSRHL